MKKRFFMMAAAVIALASCTNDEVVNTKQDDNAIGFRTLMGNSRGAETTTANLNEFWATATRIDNNGTEFSSVKFIRDASVASTENVFVQDLSSKHYWPKHGLNFYAVAPEQTLNFQAYPTRPQIENFQPADVIKDQVDLIYASNTGTRSDFTTIPLKFNHALAQICIEALNTNTQYTVKVKGFRIGYVFKKGTFTFPTPQQDKTGTGVTIPNGEVLWTGLTMINGLNQPGNNYSSTEIPDADVITLNVDQKPIRINSGASAEGGAMLIPQTGEAWVPADEDGANGTYGAYIALLVQIDKADGTPIYPANAVGKNKRINYTGLPAGYGYATVPVKIAWEAGKKYTYILDFSEGCGKVDPEKPDPDDPDDDDPFDPGDDIIGREIKFKISVTDWVEVNNGGVTSSMPNVLDTSSIISAAN